MCGINGLVGFTDAKRYVNMMNHTIRHRGPDADGLWSDEYVSLGHRRLSIIDLSPSANQPFIKGNLVIVYNGEIYNFLELRDNLIKQGIMFRTRCDTEVLLEMFRIYRERCFNKLAGMFSCGIYDMSTKELFLVRDHFGIKPLYYAAVSCDKLAFSSELKALIQLPEVTLDINHKALISCMNYLWIYGEDSIFRHIKKIPPAHYLHVKVNEKNLDMKIKSYWELKRKYYHLGEKQSIERLKDLLEKSLQRHLISDVPVGVLLSGGIDSSLISVIAKRFNRNLSAYTISMGEREKRIERMPDDNFYAERVASMADIYHKDIPVQPSVIKNLKEIVYVLDEPIGDPAAITTYLLCRAAREEGMKVLLTGMGADEIFAGYRRHYATLLAHRFNSLPVSVKKTVQRIFDPLPVRVGNHGIRQIRWMKRLLSFVDMPIDLSYMRSYSYYCKDELYKIFNYEFNSAIDEIYEDHRGVFYKRKEFDDINKMCFTDIHMFMSGLNLTYTDRCSMAASIEVRVPFIDKDLVEFAMSLDGNYKIRQGVSKYIFKQTALDYLPREIVYRPKASFGMPIRAWISKELKGMVDDLLSETSVKKRGILNYEDVRRIIEEDRKGIQDNSYRIYQMLTLELWFNRFIDGKEQYK